MLKKNIIHFWWTFFKNFIFKNKNYEKNLSYFLQFKLNSNFFKMQLLELYLINTNNCTLKFNLTVHLNLSLHFISKNNSKLNFKNNNNKLNSNFFKYELFFFFKNWKIIEKLVIPDFFWFNKFFFFKKKKFISIFMTFLKIIQNNLLIKYNTYLYCHNKTIIFEFLNLNTTTLRLKTILENFDSINKIFLDIKFYKNNCLKKFLNNSVQFNLILSKNYSAYQAFLNTHLYLIWNFLMVTNISTQSFDFLLFRNLNKYFFWTGDKYKNFWINEFSLWGVWNVFFWNGLTYHDFKFYLNKNTFIPFFNYYKFSDSIIDLNENYKNFNNFLLSL